MPQIVMPQPEAADTSRFALLFGIIDTPAFVLSDDLAIQDANPAACRWLGRRQSDLVGLPVHDFLHGWPADVLHAVKASLERDGQAQGVASLCRPDGADQPCRWHLLHCGDGSAGSGGLIMLCRALSPAGDAGDVQTQLARLIDSSTSNAIIGTTPDGVITHWNTGAERLYGYTAAEIPGKALTVLAPAEHRPRIAEVLAHVRCGASISHFETERLCKDGRRIDVSVSMSPIMDDAGTVIGISSIDHDISDRRQAERALRRNQEILVQAQRIAHLGSWEQQPGSDEQVWSEELFRIFGVSPATVHPTVSALLAMVHPDERQQVEDALNRAWRDGTAFMLDHRIIRPDGSVCFVHQQGEVIHNDSKDAVLLIGIVQDLTEIRNHQQALIRLNRALRTLSRCNHALVYAHTEDELLETMCRTIVEEGAYAQACVTLSPDRKDGEAAREICHIGPAGTGAGALSGPSSDPTRSLKLPLQVQGGDCLGTMSVHAAPGETFHPEEISLLEELAGDLAFGLMTLRIAGEHRHSQAKLQRSMEGTIQAVAATIEMRDPYTAGHQRRVALLSGAIAREMGLPEEEIKGIEMAAVIHDIGKIRIPAEILTHPGRLRESQFLLIRTHSQLGYDIVKGIDFPWPVADLVLQHHERWNGTGYPHGLKGEEIALGARIIMVADVVEAIHSDRPYRPGLGIDAALEEIAKNKGDLYDPEVAEACLRLFRKGMFSLILQPAS